MSSIRSRLVRFLVIKNYMKKVFNLEQTPIEQMRQQFIEMSKRSSLPKGTTIEHTTIAALPSEWVMSANVPPESDHVILHFHGGGVSGSCETHRSLAAAISLASRVRVLVVEYRLAPEHPYPAANEDCLTAYRWLLTNGIASQNIVISGDSFGANLALMTLLSLRDMGEPLPVAAVLFSPWDFIRFDGESYTSRRDIDPLTSRTSYQMTAHHYVGSSTRKPVSLFDQQWEGLPDLLIEVGDHEIVLSDSIRIAKYAKEAGVNVTLEVWDDMWHGFQAFSAIVPEARQALDHVGTFVQKYVG